MHAIRTIAADVPVARYTCLSVCLSVRLAPCKTAERIKVLFEVKVLGPKEHCIRWGPYSPKVEGSMRPSQKLF